MLWDVRRPNGWPLTPAILVALAIFVGLGLRDAQAAGPSPLLAQFETGPGPDGPGAQAMSWKMLAKIGVILALGLIFCLICYFAIYPTVLRRGSNPVWPLTLFGRCTALAWFLTWMAALGILWDDLVFQDEFGGTTFWREHGARLGTAAAAVGLAVLWMYLWRSDVPEKSEPTRLAQ